MGVSTGTDPITDSMALGSVAKVGDKNPQKRGKILVQYHFQDMTGYIQACLDLVADLTRGRDIFFKTIQETTRTSPKPLTDKPYQATTSPGNKPTGLEKCTESPRPDLRLVWSLQFLMNFFKQEESARERALCQLTECF